MHAPNDILPTECTDAGSDDEEMVRRLTTSDTVRIVMITGFESFNVSLYKKVSVKIMLSLHAAAEYTSCLWCGTCFTPGIYHCRYRQPSRWRGSVLAYKSSPSLTEIWGTSGKRLKRLWLGPMFSSAVSFSISTRCLSCPGLPGLKVSPRISCRKVFIAGYDACRNCLLSTPGLAQPNAGAYPQVEWVKSRIQKVPIRLVFESALELMGSTQIGTFQVHPQRRTAGVCTACPSRRCLNCSRTAAWNLPCHMLLYDFAT